MEPQLHGVNQHMDLNGTGSARQSAAATQTQQRGIHSFLFGGDINYQCLGIPPKARYQIPVPCMSVPVVRVTSSWIGWNLYLYE